MKTFVKKLNFHKSSEEIFSACYERAQAVFLDSSLENELGQYSIIGFHPYLTFQEKGGICYQNGEPLPISFEAALRAYLKENSEENPTNLPLISGAVGYFTYDYGRKFEGIKSRHQLGADIPEAHFTFYDNYLIEDCVNKVLYLTGGGVLKKSRRSVEALERWIKDYNFKEDSKEKHVARQPGFIPNFEKEDYKSAIDKMIRYIIDGDIYIANMTQQLKVMNGKEPYRVFQYLRKHNPSPFGGYLNHGDFQIVSASPERFLKVKGGLIETRPIKGTRRRGRTLEEDEELRKELQESEKDRSELLMIVDLMRNDLNRVCIPGSVQVSEHFAVEEYATVFHLVTTIIGRMHPEFDIMDLIKAVFPGGSITGAPKIRAMEIIDELENDGRGLYTGSMGYLGFDGGCDLNIIIRTAVHQNGVYYLGVGGGITCESELEFEYEETLQKAKAVLEAIYNEED